MEPRREHAELLQKSLDRYQRRLPHDVDLLRSAPSPEAMEKLAAGDRASIERLALACALYADRPAFGERDHEVDEGTIRYLPRFRTLTYADLWARVQAFASGLHHAGLVDPGDRVAISGFASVDWVVADFACLYLAAVSVPLQTGMPAADLQQVLGEAEPRTIVCSAEQLEVVAAALPAAPSVRSIILMDHEPHDRARAEALAARMAALREEHGARLVAITMEDVARIGRRDGLVPYVIPEEARDGEADPLMTIVYTSGSTGSPKGAMFPESLVREQWRAPMTRPLPSVAYVGLTYMPLNHAAGRFEVLHGVVHGGLTNFVLASDMSTLFEDIRIARPTRLMLVPRVSTMIHQHHQAELVRRAAGADPATRARVEAEIVAEMRKGYLGDRLVYAMTGTAPTPREVVDFLERCFEIPIFDGYGSTEAGLISFDGKIAHEEVTAFKLVDIPELGYRTSDEPYPRGELCVKTRRHVPGYYKNEEATQALFDAEGYIQTGDVVELHGEDEIVLVDRKKNVLKLAQGEFVSTARLEGLYTARSPFIHQIYVHGSSLRAYLLAVVVPERPAVEARLGPSPSDAAVKQLVRSELDRVAREEGLQRWEVPREILVEKTPFTRRNGLLTASNKPSRPRLQERYGAALEAMFADIERTQLQKLHALAGRGGDAGVGEQVALAVEITLGLHDVDPGQSFRELGGDSLAAVRLSTLLEERFRVPVPVGLILDPTSTLGGLVAHVESHLGGGAHAVTFAEIHGAGSPVVRAADLKLDRFLPPEELIASFRSGPPAPEPRVAFLTGANGFLGRFLLLALLERMPRDHGKVVGLVRAPSDAEARARLTAAYQSDPALAQRFHDLAAGRLEVLAGDLMRPRLGLSEAVFERLAGEVDVIVHNGALVNHAFAYPQLFEPNVLGTAEVIRLALRKRLKPIGYVSTVGVAGGLDRRDPVREDEDARALWAERPIDSGYAVGYATSKWAGEVLLRDLAVRTSLPVGVFRCSMILPHRTYAGQVNAGDFLTRLFAGIVSTGLAPRTFSAGGARAFDGLPVGFVARSIAAVTADLRAGFATYHVTRPAGEEGPSLDTMVDWIRSAGYAVDRIDDHARWLEAFRARLEALPPEQKARSPLPILSQWARPGGRELRFDNAQLRRRLAEIAARPGSRVETAFPPITESFVHKYLRDMVAAGLVPAPGAKLESAA
jgi:fatty acid CoA ligase FadD9